MTTQIREAIYTAVATANAGREGSVQTPDGRIDLALSKPPGLGGKAEDPGTNPEQLFAAGYAACFHGALLYHARSRKLRVTDSRVTARIEIGYVQDGGLGLSAALEVDLPGIQQEDAESLTSAAHAACPYSRAIRGNIEVTITVKT